jgi:hypothetical protein
MIVPSRAAFFEDLNDFQTFALGKLLQLEQLRLNRENLSVTFIGGFTDVNKERIGLRFHVQIISMLT